jgi:hypothetical protein
VAAVTQELVVVVSTLAQAHRVKVIVVELTLFHHQHMVLVVAAVLALLESMVLQHQAVMVERVWPHPYRAHKFFMLAVVVVILIYLLGY